MKKFLEGVWKFINSKVFVYIILGIGIFLLVNMYNKNQDLKDESERNDTNITALNSKVENYKTKEGEHLATVAAYESHAEELEQYNKALANDVKKEKGKIITYSNLVFRLRQDSTALAKQVNELKKLLESTKVNDSTWNMDWTLPFVYDSLNYDIFHGRTQVGIQGKIPEVFLKNITLKHNNTWLLNRDSQMKISWGQKYEKDKIKVFARTSHPAFSAQLMEGVYVDYPEKRHWFTGFGIGPQFGGGYNFLTGETAIIFGVGIHYNIFNW